MVETYHEALQNGGKVASHIPDRLRRITVQEAAAIQSFPADIPWCGAQSSRYRQIGNAVPPKMAFAVATSVAQALNLKINSDAEMLGKIGTCDGGTAKDPLLDDLINITAEDAGRE